MFVVAMRRAVVAGSVRRWDGISGVDEMPCFSLAGAGSRVLVTRQGVLRAGQGNGGVKRMGWIRQCPLSLWKGVRCELQGPTCTRIVGKFGQEGVV